MCKMKSAIILKDRVFIPDYDSHTDMLKELGIEDNRKNAENIFVRAELIPKNYNVFSPIDEWVFNVDQDIRPEWFVENYEKERMIAAVKEWAKERIHIGVDDLKISAGANHYIKDCKNVEVYGSASIRKVCGSASISEVCDSASISEAKGQAMVANSPYCVWEKQKGLILSENATFKDNKAKVIYQSGGWELRSVESEVTEE